MISIVFRKASLLSITVLMEMTVSITIKIRKTVILMENCLSTTITAIPLLLSNNLIVCCLVFKNQYRIIRNLK